MARKSKPTGAVQKTAACDPKKLTHADFERLELRVGTIKGAKPHENGQDYILLIDLGPVEQDLQVVADLNGGYEIEELVGKQVVLMLNICPEVVGGVESQALLLITTVEGKPVLISPEKKINPGVKVYGIMDSTCGHFEETGQ